MATCLEGKRQIMEVLYRRGRATVAEIQEDLPEPPGYSAVRAMLRVLEEKKHVRHEAEELRDVCTPVVPRDKVRRSAVEQLVETKTFFERGRRSRHGFRSTGGSLLCRHG